MEPTHNHGIEQHDSQNKSHAGFDDDKKDPDVAFCHDVEMVSAKPEYDTSNGVCSFEEVEQLRQGLHQRHIQMIALAGTIGTGLFLGSGVALVNGGPLGAILAFTLVGMAVGCVCLVVGEMGALMPLTGGMIRYAEVFFDPALSFADGWNQTYGCIVGLPAEIVAASVLVSFWIQVNNAIVRRLSPV